MRIKETKSLGATVKPHQTKLGGISRSGSILRITGIQSWYLDMDLSFKTPPNLGRGFPGNNLHHNV
jgi:hypothetical protein